MEKSDYFVYVSPDAQEVTICGNAVLRNTIPGKDITVDMHGLTIYSGHSFEFTHEDAEISFHLVPSVARTNEPYALGYDVIKHG